MYIVSDMMWHDMLPHFEVSEHHGLQPDFVSSFGSALSRVSLLYFAQATCVTVDIVLSLTRLSIYSGFVGYYRFGGFSSQ